MRNATIALGVIATALFASPAKACFFCDEGAYNTAMFVLTFFGIFMLGMAFFYAAYAKAGAFKKSNQTELRVLEAENIDFSTEEDKS
ncbi:hypothetical protein OAU50_00650 [Planctomycetota bacterium]|nr:hypothetical protein [Planctomycetota bacterium]